MLPAVVCKPHQPTGGDRRQTSRRDDPGHRALARAPWISGKIHQGVMPITSGVRAPRYEGAGDHRMVTDEEKIPFAGKYVSADFLVLYCSKRYIPIF